MTHQPNCAMWNKKPYYRNICDCQPEKEQEKKDCSTCKGSGGISVGEDESDVCPDCGGTGFIESSQPKEDWRERLSIALKNACGVTEEEIYDVVSQLLAEQKAELEHSENKCTESYKWGHKDGRQSVLKEIGEKLPKEFIIDWDYSKPNSKEIAHIQQGWNSYKMKLSEILNKLK